MSPTVVCRCLTLLFTLPATAQICRTVELSWPDPQVGGGVGESIGWHGDTLAAGGRNVDLGNPNGGAVYVWREQAGVFGLEQKISAPAAAGFNSIFGRSVALHGDRLVVGGNPGSNAVWLHRRVGNTWTLGGSLTGSTAQYAAYHGWAMATEGEWIAIGAPSAWVPPSTVRTGAVSVFRDQAGVVTEVAVLKPPSLTTIDDIGIALAMRGGVLVVGTAVGSSAASASLGRVAVYRIVGSLPVLEQELPVMAANPGYTTSALIGSGATFGQVVATDGQRIAVADRAADSGAGRVDVWAHQGAAWVHEGFVVGLPGSIAFGNRLAIEGDELIVSQQSGDRVSHFRRLAGAWTLVHTTPAQPSGAFRVAGIALENGRLALGSQLSPAPLADAGRVAVHELGSGSWPYGTGLAGSGGFVPDLAGNGCPRIGQSYSIDLARGLGGGIAILGAGQVPWQVSALGGTIWTAPILLTVTLGLAGGAGVAGAGTFQAPLSLPSPSLVGVRVCFQAVVLDPGAAQSFAFSNAVEVVVGS